MDRSRQDGVIPGTRRSRRTSRAWWLALAMSVALAACAGAPVPGGDEVLAPPAGGGATATAPGAGGPTPPPVPAPAPEAVAKDSKALGSGDLAAGVRGAAGAPEPSPSWALEEASRPGAPPPPPMAAGAPAPARSAPGQSGLKAGYSDDNEQFNLFLKFLGEHAATPHRELAVRERILVKALDRSGKPVANARVRVLAGGREVARGTTYSDGVYAFYPLEAGGDEERYAVELSDGQATARLEMERRGARNLTATLPVERRVPAPLPVDILFVLDTTGSMGEEIERLRATIEIINTNLSALKPKPDLRFGLVLYKDREDEYVTELQPFTADLDRFQEVLDGVSAGGGGDTPEDLEAALEAATRRMDWRPAGLRLAFAITDAPAHLDYGEGYGYDRAAREAAERGIKFYAIGTGGLPLEGEYLLRQLAQYTRGKYIFLTYGEQGESAGGTEGSVSHHTGDNFTTDKLEAVVIRFAREEIARFQDKAPEWDESYFAAKKVEDQSREDTLAILFERAIGNLDDYSAYRVEPGTRVALLPFAAEAGGDSAAQAEYFGAQALVAAAKAKRFTLVERKDLQRILAELELGLSGLADEDAAARVGKLLGAELLVTGELYDKGERWELFLKLVRVETAEVLSATKARIDKALGLR